MEKVINETVEMAHEHFKKFGFEDAQIVQLLESGKRDLTKELNKLQKILDQEPIEIDKVNLSIHALKGLFLTMGNAKAGEKLTELHNKSGDTRILAEIKFLLDL